MIGISARPAGSLGKMLHQLCELAKGTTRTFLLQRMSPLMAHRVACCGAATCPESGSCGRTIQVMTRIILTMSARHTDVCCNWGSMRSILTAA